MSNDEACGCGLHTITAQLIRREVRRYCMMVIIRQCDNGANGYGVASRLRVVCDSDESGLVAVASSGY